MAVEGLSRRKLDSWRPRAAVFFCRVLLLFVRRKWWSRGRLQELRMSPGPVLGADRVLDETACPAAEFIAAACVQDKVQVHYHAT